VIKVSSAITNESVAAWNVRGQWPCCVTLLCLL